MFTTVCQYRGVFRLFDPSSIHLMSRLRKDQTFDEGPLSVYPATKYPIVSSEFEVTAADQLTASGKLAPDIHASVPNVHFSVDFKSSLPSYPPIICIVLVSSSTRQA